MLGALKSCSGILSEIGLIADYRRNHLRRRPSHRRFAHLTHQQINILLHPPSQKMSLLLSGPPEILIGILHSCDNFTQLLALITTCKHVHGVWVANPGTVIWEIGQRCIMVFDDALMAVSKTFLFRHRFFSRHVFGSKYNEHMRVPKPQV
jgi:hypothetical protein